MRPEFNRLEMLRDPGSGLRALGSRSKVNHVESLQEHVRLLNEACKKFHNKTIVLKENVAVLGEMANIMRLMTVTMARYSREDSELEIKDENLIELLMDGLETLGDVADLMFNMSQLMTPLAQG